MDPEHYNILKNHITDVMDVQQPNLWQSYQKKGLPFCQYIWDLIYHTDLNWIKNNLYPYLNDEDVEKVVRKIVREYSGIEETLKQRSDSCQT
jgi:hypothetical protein